ncbi:pilus assembly protein TadG-related protein [Roseomonas sp. GCM10028921]
MSPEAAAPHSRCPRLDNRGSTSAFVAASATVLLGFVGLAADGGAWYLSLRDATTAADLAALAGARALIRDGDGIATARDTATQNGFDPPSGATVQVNIPPSSGSFAGRTSAVEVTIARPQPVKFAGLFVTQTPVIRTRAVAITAVAEQVCLLALGGGLELGGNSTSNARDCTMASNATSPGGISVVGSALVRTTSLVTTGLCSGCSSGDVWTSDARTERPVIDANRPDPIIDPFASLRSWTPTPPPTCQDLGSSRTMNASPGLLCNVTVGTNDTLHLSPGLYYVKGDLTVQGTINGDGVTLVMTGEPDNVGTIRINAQAKGTLRGPASSKIPGYPAAAGLVLYRDARATNNGPSKEVQLNGGAAMDIFGGIYLPTSDVVINGRSSMGSNCFSIVGYRLSLSGNSDTQVDVSGCAGFAPYPTVRVARLVE